MKSIFEQAGRNLKEIIQPSIKTVEESFPWIQELDLRLDELQWIAEVKKATDEYHVELGNRRREYGYIMNKKKEGKKLSDKEEILVAKDFPREGIPGLDLLRIHLETQRDLKKGGFSPWMRKTEKLLDKVLLDIVVWLENEGEFSVSENMELEKKFPHKIWFRNILEEYKQTKDFEGKMVVLTKFLDVIHRGGRAIVLEGMFVGIPRPQDMKYGASSWRFLENLNNVGSGPSGPKMYLENQRDPVDL